MVRAAAEPAIPATGSDTAPAVRAANVTKKIDDRVILRHVSFSVPTGSFTVLLGANGAGKSTLLRAMATLTPISGGTLELFGVSARGDLPRVRARIGLIGHQFMLYRDLTALENLVFFGKLYRVPQPRQRALELLERVGLSDRRDDPVKTFSRGMGQRVAIARALMHGPDLVLADEPFAGLDAPSARMLEGLLGGLHAEGKTIILANHDIVQSLRVSERAIVLRRGRVAMDGASGELDEERVLAEVVDRRGGA